MQDSDGSPNEKKGREKREKRGEGRGRGRRKETETDKGEKKHMRGTLGKKEKQKIVETEKA